MAPFPLIQLGTTLVRQISKPIANIIKERAKNSEFFKKYVCTPPAQFYHWYDVNLRMRMLGIETKNVAKMNEDAAVTLGADILGEAVILSIAVACVVIEYARRAKNESAKEMRQQERLTKIEKRIAECEVIVADQSSHIQRLQQLLENYKPSIVQKAKQLLSSTYVNENQNTN